MKYSKKYITILLTYNAIGNEKLSPLFIHKYENPRTLKNINKKNLLVNYYWNQKSWMLVSIWNEYIKKLDFQMWRQNQQILLFIDNILTHILHKTTYFINITIEHLPPNTIAHFQPYNQGIINSFKVSNGRNFLIIWNIYEWLVII